MPDHLPKRTRAVELLSTRAVVLILCIGGLLWFWVAFGWENGPHTTREQFNFYLFPTSLLALALWFMFRKPNKPARRLPTVNAQNDRSRWLAIWFLLTTAPVYVFFIYLGQPAAGFVAWLFLMLLLTAIWVRWELRRRLWFWITIGAIAVMHAPLIIYVPWSDAWIPRGIILFAFMCADEIVIFGIIRFVEARVHAVEMHAHQRSRTVHE